MAYPTLLGWHQTRYADVMYTSFQSCDNSSFSYNSWIPTMDAWLLQTPWLWRMSSYGADAGFTFFFHNIRFWYSVNPVGDTGDGRGTRQFGVHDGDGGWLLEKVNKIFFLSTYLYTDVSVCNFQSLRFMFRSSNRKKKLKFVCLEGVNLKNAERESWAKKCTQLASQQWKSTKQWSIHCFSVLL